MRKMRWLIPTTIAFVIAIVLVLPNGSAQNPDRVKPALGGNRGPFAIAFTSDGTRAVVTEFDEGAIAIIDIASERVLRHISSGGSQPTGVGVTRDGRTAIVANSFSGSVAFVDLASGKEKIVDTPGAPWGVALSPDDKKAYVSISQLDQVAVFDIATGSRLGNISTDRRPRALAISPDGGTLVSANLTAGSVSYLDTAAMTERNRGLTPAVNLRGVALYPDNRTVFAVGQRAQNERPTESAVGIWSNQAFVQVPEGPRNGLQNLWLDLMGQDVADPDSVVLDNPHRRAFVSCSGGDSVNVVPINNDGDTIAIRNVGAQPRGMAITSDRKQLWVANLLSNDIAVIDTSNLKLIKRINLGPTSRHDSNLLGRYLFGSATIVNGAQFSCNSCHPDGGSDGISWKFTHVQDALGNKLERNVKGLRGEIAESPPYRWSGREATLAAFIKQEAVGLLHSPPINVEQVNAIATYVGSLPQTRNPNRAPGGTLTLSAQRGKALFEVKGGCIACHTTSPKELRRSTAVWIGTTPKGVLLKAPRLDGVFDTYPYLHDGSAPTLESVFSEHNQQKLHGKANLLNKGEISDLLQYVKEL